MPANSDPQLYPDKARAIKSQLLLAFPNLTTSKPTDPDYKQSQLILSMTDLLVDIAIAYAASDMELQKLKNPKANRPTV